MYCLLLATGVAACADLDLSPVPFDGGSSSVGGSGGDGGGGPNGGSPNGGSPPEQPPDRPEQGFPTLECEGASTTDGTPSSRSVEAGAGALELADRDCDGLADTCVVDGDCASEALVLQYLFEQSLRDATVHRNDATNVSNVSYEPGLIGDALRLGPSSRADLPRSESLDLDAPLTVELWVQPHAFPPTGGRAGLLDDDGRYGLFLTPEGKVTCVAGGASITGTELTLGEWAHVACVLGDSTLTLWQYGQARAQVASTTHLVPGASPLVIGGNAPSGDRFEGSLDNLRLWREARSASQLIRAAHTR